MSAISAPLMALLRALAQRDEVPLSALAGALMHPSDKETADTLSAITAQLIAAGRRPAEVIDALVRIDGQLMAAGAIHAPFAARWASLAAERAIHAEQDRWEESADRMSADRSPIFPVGRSTLYAVPAGPLRVEGMQRFADRVLLEVMKRRPKRVYLVLVAEDPANEAAAVQAEVLVCELRQQKVEVRVITAPAASHR